MRSTFEHVQKWVDDARNHRGNDIMIVLVGNKLDDEEKRQVTTDEGASLARQLAVGEQEVQFIETSAKAGLFVKQLFKNIASNLPGMQNTTGSGST